MRKFKKAAVMICIAETLIVVGGTAACAAKNSNTAPQPETIITSEAQPETETAPPSGIQPKTETAPPSEAQPKTETAPPGEAQPKTEAAPPSGIQQAEAPISEAPQTTVQTNIPQQNANQPAPSGNGQISLEDAKNAALTDAGLSAADVIYTKEKLDYEDGIAVYEIEFYAGNVDYEYEINAATGTVYSKSVETYHNQTEHGHNGHNGHAGTSNNYISIDSAKSIALNHAGFSETEVSRLKSEFDIDDGAAVYEVEFDKDGREYEYTINAADGSIIEFDLD